MPWYDPDDHSAPVIDPVSQIKSKYPGMQVPVLPARAVVFCLGKGIPVLKEHYPCYQVMEKLPGFITHSEVLGINGIPGVCFLHGGYAAPQITCTIETLLLVQEEPGIMKSENSDGKGNPKSIGKGRGRKGPTSFSRVY